ncbi:MAG: tetratricopeptide repeat protein [Tepidisphaeraceae bacterium]
MADAHARIEQFKTMSEANPKDDLAFFSLGRAYLEAQQPDQAAGAFKKVIELNPKMSKAYQLLAQTQFVMAKQLDAIESLKAGVRIAHDRGDMMPRNDMLKTLKEHGVTMPEFEAAQQPAQPVGDGEVHCKRCGLVKPKMARAPLLARPGKNDPGQCLCRLLARMDPHGHESHQRTPPPAQ